MADNVLEILLIAGLFVLRIGIPVVVLILLGLLVDRWQSRREEKVQQQVTSPPMQVVEEAEDIVEEIDRAA